VVKLLRALGPVIFLAALAVALPLRAENMDQPSAQKLKQLENEIAKGQAERDKAAQHAAAIAAETDKLRGEMVDTASSAQEHEENLTDLEGRMFELDGDVAQKQAQLDRARAQSSGVIAALARLASNPTGALIGEPAPPADTVRTAILLRAAVPNLEASAKLLRDQLDALAKARQAVAVQKTKIAGTDHKRLATLYARREAARDQADAQTKESETRLASLAGEAADMRDLLAKLDAEQKRLREEREAIARQAAEAEAERQKRLAALAKPAAPPPAPEPKPQVAKVTPPPPKSITAAQGRMPFPARGTVTVHYGQVNDSGMPAKGITIATRSGAQVVAPFDGEVAFAGPFRGYGLLLIIEHGEGYHSLLAGMARIDCQVGQHLVAGEPVGVMVDTEEKPLLYVELRHQGQPINPLPWLAARKSKVIE